MRESRIPCTLGSWCSATLAAVISGYPDRHVRAPFPDRHLRTPIILTVVESGRDFVGYGWVTCLYTGFLTRRQSALTIEKQDLLPA